MKGYRHPRSTQSYVIDWTIRREQMLTSRTRNQQMVEVETRPPPGGWGGGHYALNTTFVLLVTRSRRWVTRASCRKHKSMESTSELIMHCLITRLRLPLRHTPTRNAQTLSRRDGEQGGGRFMQSADRCIEVKKTLLMVARLLGEMMMMIPCGRPTISIPAREEREDVRDE